MNWVQFLICFTVLPTIVACCSNSLKPRPHRRAAPVWFGAPTKQAQRSAACFDGKLHHIAQLRALVNAIQTVSVQQRKLLVCARATCTMFLRDHQVPTGPEQNAHERTVAFDIPILSGSDVYKRQVLQQDTF